MPEIQTNPEFYTPWPKFGKRLNFQWGEERQNTAVLKAIARAQVQDVETGDDYVNADRILAGLEFGELTNNTTSFKNQFRLFYDKDEDKFCIQRNTGTEESPTWIDYLCIDQASGLVTVVGLDAGALGIGSSGGFYGLPDQRLQRVGEIGNASPTVFAPPKTGALWFNAEDFYLTAKKGDPHRGTPVINLKNSIGIARTYNATGNEWIINHGFNISPVMAQVFDNQDQVIIPGLIDVSDPNTAYFYFDSQVSGKVIIATGGLGVAEIAPLDPFYLLVRQTNVADVPKFSDFADILFDQNDFYVRYRAADHQAIIGLGDRFSALSSRVDTLGSEIADKFYGIIVKETDDNPPAFRNDTIIFDSSVFYLSPDSTGKPIVSIRTPAVIDHGQLQGLADDDHTQYTLADGTRAFTGTQSMGGNRLTNVGEPTAATDAARLQDIGPGFYGIVVKQSDGLQSFEGIRVVNFNTESFYLKQNASNSDEVMVNFRGSSGGGGGVTDHGALSGLGDDDHPQYLLRTEASPGFYGIYVRESDGNPPTFRNDTLIFDSTDFYLSPNSVGKPTVSLRGSASDSTSASNLGAGSGVFAQEVANDLQFKSLVAGSNVTITSSSTEITIASTASGGSGFYSVLSNLEDVQIRNPQGYDFLQFYSTEEGHSLKWQNRPYLQIRQIALEDTNNRAEPGGGDTQGDTAVIFTAREIGSLRPKLWVRTNLRTGSAASVDPAFDLSRDNITSVNNASGSTVTRGQIVYHNGGITANPRVSLADASSATTMPAIGVVFSESIANNQAGSIMIRGILGGLDTSAFTAGALVYVSGTTPGAYTTTAPSTINSLRQPIGLVTRSSSTIGRIYFNFGLIDKSYSISDGSNSHQHYSNLGVNHNQFYLTRNSGRTVINWELEEGFKDVEVTLSGDSKNVNWDWGVANSFRLALQKNTTIHTPSNRPTRGKAQQVNLVVSQPSGDFYNITFSRKFKFPGGDHAGPTERANAVDLYSFHISSALGSDFIMSVQAADLFY